VTVRDYIASSLRLLGVLAPADTFSEATYPDTVQSFSDMLDAWSTERLTIFSQGRTENALVAGTQRYTIGAAGNWNQARPLWIDGAAFLTVDGLEVPIRVFTRTEWQAISLKDLSGPQPFGIFYDPNYPLGAMDVWPVPTDPTVQLVLYVPSAPLTSVSSLDTVITVPPGWAKAIRYNLAVEFGPLYPGTVSDDIAEIARVAKANIKRTNILLDEMTLDPFLTNRGRRWSIKAGEFV
jgi:hypothetical protein